jgi:hypothetical protein
MKRIQFAVAAITLLGSGAVFGGDLKPVWIFDGTKGHVNFPPSFVEATKNDYPSLRLPTKKDIIGYWQVGHPYAAWSDFNGDKLTDIAIILVSETHHKIAIYHQPKEGTFVYAYPASFRGLISNNEVGPPQDYYVGVHLYDSAWFYRRENYEMDTKGYRSQTETRYWIKNDGVVFGTYESGLYLTYWHNGKYLSLGSGVD